jgi:hypothetical protein
MRYVVALLRSTSRILAAAVDEDNRLSVEPALEGVTHALLMLARRFGDGVEPAALEELRNHRRELVTQIAELRARSLPDWVQNLPRVLDAWEEHLQRSQAADDAHGAALLEHQVKQLAVDAPW